MDKTHRVFTFIKQFMEEQQIPPTMQEIADGVGYTSRTAPYYHIKKLVEWGWIERDPKKARGMRILRK